MNTKRQFLLVDEDLLASPALSQLEKNFIANILGWQSNNLTCHQSNLTLATKFGVSIRTINNTITKLKTFDFFMYESKSIPTNASWFNSKIIMIDEEKLNQFLEESKPEINRKELSLTEPIINIPIDRELVEDINEELDENINEESVEDNIQELVEETIKIEKMKYKPEVTDEEIKQIDNVNLLAEKANNLIQDCLTNKIEYFPMKKQLGDISVRIGQLDPTKNYSNLFLEFLNKYNDEKSVAA